jgi:chromosome segregation ATPase
MEQRADLMAGGPQQRVAQAQANYNAAQATNQNLEDQRLSMERDIERNEKRIAAAQGELKSTNAALADARAKKKLSEQQFSKLKSESDSLNRDLAKLDLQVQQDRGNNAASADIAAKEARIKELERRKAELDRTIKLALGT